MIHRGGVSAHLQPCIEQVIFLIGLVLSLLDLLQLQIVAALFANLGDGYHTELKATGFLVVLHHLLAEAENVKVEDMSIAATFAIIKAEEIEAPHGEIARIQKAVVGADGIIGNDERGLHDVDEIGLGVGF